MCSLPVCSHAAARAATSQGTYGDVLTAGLQAVRALRNRTVAIFYAGGQRADQVDIYRIPLHADPALPVLGVWHTQNHYQLLHWGGPRGGPTLALLLEALRTPPEGGAAVQEEHILTLHVAVHDAPAVQEAQAGEHVSQGRRGSAP